MRQLGGDFSDSRSPRTCRRDAGATITCFRVAAGF